MSTAIIGTRTLSTAAINAAAMNPAAVRTAVVNPASADRGDRRRRTRLRLTRRGRAAVALITVVPLLVGAAVFTVNGAAAASDTARSTAFAHVTVLNGQSLWQIAEQIAPTADPRDVINAISDLNQLDSSVLVPGQQLAIPTRYTPAAR